MITSKLLADWLLKKGFSTSSVLWIIACVHLILYTLLLFAVFLPVQTRSTLIVVLLLLVLSFSIQMTFLNKYLKSKEIG
jgi:hypothetical protein